MPIDLYYIQLALLVCARVKKFCGNDHLDPLMELYRRLPGKTCSSVSTIDPFEAAERLLL